MASDGLLTKKQKGETDSVEEEKERRTVAGRQEPKIASDKHRREETRETYATRCGTERRNLERLVRD